LRRRIFGAIVDLYLFSVEIIVYNNILLLNGAIHLVASVKSVIIRINGSLVVWNVILRRLHYVSFQIINLSFLIRYYLLKMVNIRS
jgi:hypothetical protein